MATATVFRGKAAFAGVASTATTSPTPIDCLLYAQRQTMDLTQQWEEEIIKDSNGFDICWGFRNEHEELDVMLKMIDYTSGSAIAHALAPVSNAGAASPNTTGTTGLSTLGTAGTGQPFFAPGSCLVLTGFPLLAVNACYLIMAGSKVTMKNVNVAELQMKMRAYADTTDQLVYYVPS